MDKNTGPFLLFFFSFLFFAPLVSLFAMGSRREEKLVLNVYSYDSFSSEWGPGPHIAQAFEEKWGIPVLYTAPGDAVTVLNQLVLEKNRPQADVVIGLDNSLLHRVLEEELLISYDSPLLTSLDPELIFDESLHLLPYDYGDFAINYNKDLVSIIPRSLEDLTQDIYAQSLVLIDPRSSTVGRGFFLWTQSVYGDQWPQYWERLAPSILTISKGWSQAYSLFSTGESAMVISYGSSPVYHVEYEEDDRFRAAEFVEGHVRQVEGMGIIAGSPHREQAEKFVDFMLSKEIQLIIARYNIMFPVRSDLLLPESFEAALRPSKTIALLATDFQEDSIESLNQRWLEIFQP